MQNRLLSFVIFFAIASLLVGSVHYYVWWRLVKASALADPWARVGTWAVTTLAIGTPAAIVLSRWLPRPSGHWLATVVFVWVGVLMLLLTALLAAEIVRAIVFAGTSFTGKPVSPERRQLMQRALAGAALATAVGSGAYAIWNGLREVAIKRIRVVLSRLPAKMSGFRIVQLTDLHVGDGLDGAWLARIVAKTNALEPDLVAITGDLVDGTVDRLRSEIACLSALRAKHGVYFVTGNHEYYSGADEWIQELRAMGIHVLHNERVAISTADGDSFDLAGVDDYSAFGVGHGPDLARALAGREPSRELVLLAHQPREIWRAEAARVGLQLSGHTHGGQIFPWNYAVLLQQPYVAGLFRQGGTQIYVSRGTGFWGPPMRLCAPAEITLVELAAAPTAEA